MRAGEIPQPDVIVVGAGTCGTKAGLTAGSRLAGLDLRSIGVCCVDRIVCHSRAIARLANGVLLGSACRGESTPTTSRTSPPVHRHRNGFVLIGMANAAETVERGQALYLDQHFDDFCAA